MDKETPRVKLSQCLINVDKCKAYKLVEPIIFRHFRHSSPENYFTPSGFHGMLGGS